MAHSNAMGSECFVYRTALLFISTKIGNNSKWHNPLYNLNACSNVVRLFVSLINKNYSAHLVNKRHLI